MCCNEEGRLIGLRVLRRPREFEGLAGSSFVRDGFFRALAEALDEGREQRDEQSFIVFERAHRKEGALEPGSFDLALVEK